MGSTRSRANAAGLVIVAGGCGTDESSASPPDVATLETSAVPTAAATTPPVAPTNTASSTDVVLTTSSGAVASVPTTVASTEPLDAGAVSEGLGQARVRWSDADIASYRLTVAESRSIWGVGLHLVHRGLERVVTERRAEPSERETREWTVEQLHEIIAER